MTTWKPSDITHLILDLGGVLFDIRTEEDWLEEYMKPLLGNDIDVDALMHLYDEAEHGRLSNEALKLNMEELSGERFSMSEFEYAWNGRLLDMPEENMRAIEYLSGKYDLYLLSNTNQIHYDSWWYRILEKFGEASFPKAFKGFFYSHEMGVMKPSHEIYRQAHKRMNEPSKQACLFLDDSVSNVEGARQFGWNAELETQSVVKAIAGLGL